MGTFTGSLVGLPFDDVGDDNTEPVNE